MIYLIFLVYYYIKYLNDLFNILSLLLYKIFQYLFIIVFLLPHKIFQDLFIIIFLLLYKISQRFIYYYIFIIL